MRIADQVTGLDMLILFVHKAAFSLLVFKNDTGVTRLQRKCSFFACAMQKMRLWRAFLHIRRIGFEVMNRA